MKNITTLAIAVALLIATTSTSMASDIGPIGRSLSTVGESAGLISSKVVSAKSSFGSDDLLKYRTLTNQSSSFSKVATAGASKTTKYALISVGVVGGRRR
jgi:hypothetical protein